MNRHRIRVIAALVGASAIMAMGTLSVATAATPAQENTVVPQHFGGPVYTSIYSPTATLSMPTVSTSPTEEPSPLSAAG